jgi:hypothetical protein
VLGNLQRSKLLDVTMCRRAWLPRCFCVRHFGFRPGDCDCDFDSRIRAFECTVVLIYIVALQVLLLIGIVVMRS